MKNRNGGIILRKVIAFLFVILCIAVSFCSSNLLISQWFVIHERTPSRMVMLIIFLVAINCLYLLMVWLRGKNRLGGAAVITCFASNIVFLGFPWLLATSMMLCGGFVHYIKSVFDFSPFAFSYCFVLFTLVVHIAFLRDNRRTDG